MTLQFASGTTGRSASLGYRFFNADGSWNGARVTASIAEVGTTGNYVADSVSVPGSAAGVYWDDTGIASNNASEALDVVTIRTKTDFLPSATAGASGGLLIAGSNAATTFATLTCTGTLTVGGDFDITGGISTGVGVEISGGIVVSGSTTLAAVTATTITTSGTVTLNALTVTAGTTFTGAVTGTHASNDLRLGATQNGANADALLNRDMSAVTVTNSRSPINSLRALRNKFTTAGGTYTVYKEDDVTSAWTATLTTDPTADPITASDPA